jgi:hypothetical protein
VLAFCELGVGSRQRPFITSRFRSHCPTLAK